MAIPSMLSNSIITLPNGQQVPNQAPSPLPWYLQPGNPQSAALSAPTLAPLNLPPSGSQPLAQAQGPTGPAVNVPSVSALQALLGAHLTRPKPISRPSALSQLGVTPLAQTLNLPPPTAEHHAGQRLGNPEQSGQTGLERDCAGSAAQAVRYAGRHDHGRKRSAQI